MRRDAEDYKFHFIVFLNEDLFIYLRAGEHACKSEWGEEQRARDKQIPRWAGSPMQGLISRPWNHDLRGNRKSDAQLNELPKSPRITNFKKLANAIYITKFMKAAQYFH